MADQFTENQFHFDVLAGYVGVKLVTHTDGDQKTAISFEKYSYLLDPTDTITPLTTGVIVVFETVRMGESVTHLLVIPRIDGFLATQFKYSLDRLMLIRDIESDSNNPEYTANFGKYEYQADPLDIPGLPSAQQIITETVAIDDSGFVFISSVVPVDNLYTNQFGFRAGQFKFGFEPVIVAGREYEHLNLAHSEGFLILIDTVLGKLISIPSSSALQADMRVITWESVATPKVELFIGGIDASKYLVFEDGIGIEYTLDTPSLTVFTASSVMFSLDNFLGDWDYGNPNNFFARNDLSLHGHKQTVVLKLGFEDLSGDKTLAVFAGIIDDIALQTENTLARILCLDMSSTFRGARIFNFGNDATNLVLLPNAAYTRFNPVFDFFNERLAISIDSVSVITPAGVTVQESVRTEGPDLTYLNAQVDHDGGFLRFEQETPNGSSEVVTANWKFSFHHKRPDTIVRLLAENQGLFDRLSWTDKIIARAAIEETIIRHSTVKQFSSHGRPMWAENTGVVRYLKIDDGATSTSVIDVFRIVYMIQNTRFVKYDWFQDEYAALTTSFPAIDSEQFYPFQFDTVDFVDFYFLCSPNITGDSMIGDKVRIYKWNITSGFELIASELDEFPQLTHPYGQSVGTDFLADNRKHFQVVDISGVIYVYYIFANPNVGTSGIKRYNRTTNLSSVVLQRSNSSALNIEYSYDFLVRISAFYETYVFLCYNPLLYGTSGKLELWQMEADGTNQALIYEELFSTSNDKIPAVVSDVVLQNDKFWFILGLHRITSGFAGESELSMLPRVIDEDDSRLVVKSYSNVFNGARSGVGKTVLDKFDGPADQLVFYLEGSWMNTLPFGSYPSASSAGSLIEIDAISNVLTNQGLIWVSEVSPDPVNPTQDGFGVHNAIVSNMVFDNRDNVHFVTGFGLPFDLDPDSSSPETLTTSPVSKKTNFQWIQYGFDLAGKIERVDTNNQDVWTTIETMAALSSYEVGFSSDQDLLKKVETLSEPGTEFGRQANCFFRPRSLIKGFIIDAIGLGDITFIRITSPENKRFKAPGVNLLNYVIIGEEIFSYTGVPGDGISGVERGKFGTTTSSHTRNDSIYFIHGFAMNQDKVQTLKEIRDRRQDFPNVYNVIEVSYGDRTAKKINEASISDHGRKEFPAFAGTFLGSHDAPWAETLAEFYLTEYGELKEAAEIVIKFSPYLQIGQLLLFHDEARFISRYKKMRILRINHNTQDWTTVVLCRETL